MPTNTDIWDWVFTAVFIALGLWAVIYDLKALVRAVKWLRSKLEQRRKLREVEKELGA